MTTRHFVVFDFGSNVKASQPFASAEIRRIAMEHVLEGREEALYKTKCSDGKVRRLGAAIAAYAVDEVTR